MKPKKPKRKKELIVHITSELNLRETQKVCVSLVQELHKTEFESYLITNKHGALLEDITRSSNIFLVDGLQSSSSIQSLMDDFRSFFTIIKKLRALKKEYKSIIVHTHSTKAGLIGRWAALFAGVKYRIHTIHGYAFHKYQPKIIWLLIYLQELITSFITTHFICVSAETAKKGVKLFPRFGKKHSIIKPAVNCEEFNLYRPAQRSYPEKSFIFGTVAYFTPTKNVLDTLKAFATCFYRNPNIKLEIVGDGPEKPKIIDFIKQHNLQDKVILHGLQKNIAVIMKNWDAFVFTSLCEGTPCVIVEARLLKLPVISYKVGGIQDIITNKENGLLYSSHEWESISKAMYCVSIDKVLYEKLQNYDDNFTHFTYRTMVEQHQNLYRSIL